jgi:RecB family endonuclease NucS
MRTKVISVGEKDELEPMLVEYPEVIEEGLKVISHQQPTDTGRYSRLQSNSSTSVALKSSR